MKIADRVAGFSKQIAGAKVALANLHELDGELRAAHAEAIRARQHLHDAPAPLSEALAAMERLVDERAAKWAAGEGRGLLASFTPRIEARISGDVHRPAEMPEFLTFRDLRGDALVGLFPGLLKARLREILSSVEYAAGPPTADRARLLAEADVRIREIEDQHAELCDMAAALDPPVELVLLPAVQARRATEAARLRRETAAREQREALEAEINERAIIERGRPRVARSQYLAANRPGTF